MKKLKKWLIRIFGILFIILACLFVYVSFFPLKTYEVKAPQISIQKDSASVAEGRRMAVMLCQQCHKSEKGVLEGALMEDGDFGKVYSANITQHPEYGIGGYSEGELAYLLRTGVTRDGRYTPPWMLKLPHISDDDLNNIIAFLKSDDPLVKPSTNQVPKPAYSFLSKALIKFGIFSPLPYPEEKINAPDPSDQIAFGRYQAVSKWDCYGCHSLDFTKMDIMEPEKTVGFFGGGNPFEVEGSDQPVYSANLTFDKETGIGNWSEEDFVTTIKSGRRPDNKMVRSPMTPFALMTDEEAKAIYAFLKSLPVIKNDKLKDRQFE